MKRRHAHFAVLTVLLVAACACFLAATLSFATVRRHLDSLTGDGSADFYTPLLHGRVRIYLSGLGLSFVLASAWLRAVTVRPAADESLLSAVGTDFRHLRDEIAAFVRAHAGPLITLTLAALLMRLPWIDQPIRYDEAHTFIHYADRPAYVTIATYAEPNNHVFHSLCVHIATRVLGPDEWAIRLPALIAGVLTVPATFALGFLWGGGVTGWLAALAVAASSPLIEYSVNARGYSLLCLLTVCLLLLAHASLRRRSPAVWGTMSLLAAVGLWTVPTMLYACLLVLIWLIAALATIPHSPPADRWRGLCVCLAATAILTTLLYSPILIVEGPMALLSAGLPGASDGPDVARGLTRAVTQTGRLLFRDLPWPAYLLLAAGWLLTLRPALRKRNAAPALLLLSAGVCLILVLVQRVLPPPRTWLFLLPPLYCGAVWGVTTSFADRQPAVRYAVVTAVGLLLVVWPGVMLVRHDSISRSAEGGLCPDAEAAVVWMRSSLTPSDAVIATTPCSAPLVYYALRHGLPLQHFDPPDSSTPREIPAVIVVPTGRAGHVAPDEVLQELGLEDNFAGHRLEVVHEFHTVKLLRAMGPLTAP